MNNFKRLEDEENELIGIPPKDIKVKIDDSVGFFRFVGNVVDLFLPRMIGAFTNLLGGGSRYGQLDIGNRDLEDDEHPPKYPNKAE